MVMPQACLVEWRSEGAKDKMPGGCDDARACKGVRTFAQYKIEEGILCHDAKHTAGGWCQAGSVLDTA